MSEEMGFSKQLCELLFILFVKECKKVLSKNYAMLNILHFVYEISDF